MIRNESEWILLFYERKKGELSMTVNNNVNAHGGYRGITTSASAANSLQKLASGSKINSAADDAAGLAISEQMNSVMEGLTKASQNAQNGISLVQTADGALSGSSDILSRMKELATQAANGTYTDSDRAALSSEFNQLKESLNQIASGTNYNGTNLLDGSIDGDNALTLQVGSNAGQTASVSVGNMSAEGLGIADLDIGSLSGASSAIEALGNALNSVSSTRGDLGAVQNRLESTVTSLETGRENIAASASTIRDLDMAKEASNLVQKRIQQEATNSMAAQSMNLMRQNAAALLK